jgi:hypothetical protein
MAAARKGNDQIVRMFLDKCSTVDIDRTINVYIELRRDKISNYWNGPGGPRASFSECRSCFFCGEYCEYWTYLCESCAHESGRTALWLACFYGHLEVVRTLIEIGKADINISNDANWTPLRAAIHYTIKHHSENLSTIKTLLKHGSDPTIQDAQGETALHYAIRCQNKEIVQEILHYGFKHNQRDEYDLTPLMAAMDMELEDILDIFYQILPRQEYIDEMMLLGCLYAFKYQYLFAGLNPRAFIFFEKALKLQESNSNAQPCDVYKFRRECQTIDELRAIQFNRESMYIQALLVYERLLPQRNEISLLIPDLFTFYTYYLDNKDYNQCLLILIHLYPMILSCKEDILNTWHTDDCLKRFVDLLNSLMINQDMKYIDYIIRGFKWTLNRFFDSKTLCHICLCATYVTIPISVQVF